MRVLLICGDGWHPAKVPVQGMRALEAFGIETDVHAAGVPGFEQLCDYPVVVLAKGDKRTEQDATPWMAGEASHAFWQYARGGGGVLFLHAGAAVKQGADAMCELMGHRFTHHPERCEVAVRPLKKHPITEGVGAFSVVDEHYFVNILAPEADILFLSESAHGTQAAGHARQICDGRVAALTPGHTLDVWLHPEYQKAIVNAIHWCKGES